MKLIFLGGANEVGASCTLLELAGKRILVDAGMRMTKRDGSVLPDLTRLQEGGPLDAILLTHAHTDHIGALPLVHLAFPQVPILATDPTKALARVLLQDSLRIMESRWEQEEEIPLYPPHAVEGMLSRTRIVPVGQPVPVLDGFVATYIPSGHILGACSITLETPEGTILFAGDYSLDRQHTIEGMILPKERPDLMITESTYGNRIHSNRRQEEERLCQAVTETIAGGGKVLIPSFALGRAQEVILILLEAQKKGHIPKFPVYVDGMVKTMCQVYGQYPEWLEPRLRRQVETSGNPFFFAGGAIQVMGNGREEVLKGPPCCIVASSGMLTGGASKMYAQVMVSDPKNAIFMTGYQDEESPGHQLLELAREVQENGVGVLRMDGVTKRVVCKVNRYGLSAHADGGQLLSVVCKMNPKHVVLVHGDQDARTALSATFPQEMKVYLPDNGNALSFAAFSTPRKGSSAPVVFAGIGEADEPLRMEKLYAALLKKDGPGQRYTLSELAQRWYGRSTAEGAEAMRVALEGAKNLFQPDRNRPFLFSTVGGKSQQRQSFAPRGTGPKTEEGQVLKVAQERLQRLPDFEKLGCRSDQKVLLLHFDFPDRALLAYPAIFEELSTETGWGVEVSMRVDQKAYTEAARQVFPLTWDIARISVFPKEMRVRARVRLPTNTSEEEKETVLQRYREKTGKALDLEPLVEAPPQKLFDEKGRMEHNAARRRLHEALAERGVALLSFSKKGEPAYLELGLVSPQIAEKHKDLIASLAQEVGWELRLRPSANQAAVAIRARQLMPEAWATRKEPAFLEDQATVRFAITCEPDPALLQKASAQLEQETGFRLTVATLSASQPLHKLACSSK